MEIENQHQRRSANYKPNIWKPDFLESLSNTNDMEDEFKTKAKELVEYVKCMLSDSMLDQLGMLELIDTITKLGLANLFDEEIKEALDIIASTRINNHSVQGSLYATSLRFRLLRQHSYQVSQEDLREFMDEQCRFRSNITKDVKGILELFEASNLGFESENIMEEANTFSIKTLDLILPSLEINIAKRVEHALEIPWQWRIKWFDVKWQINVYEDDNKFDSKLLELAKLNHNTVQSVLQKDMGQISRWWRNLGLMENLNFARERVVESFMCAMGLSHDIHSRSFRKCLTKIISLILIIDDVYDLFGSLEELHHFTCAVDRWDAKETLHLPECMKVCFQALCKTTDDIAYEIVEEKGWDHASLYLRKAWADFCKALYVEAKWCNKGYTPSLQEYLNNAWISSSGPLLFVSSLLASTDEKTGDILCFLQKNHHLIYNVSLFIRLSNDLGTSAAEVERGDVASSILCYMREKNVGEEIARNYIESMIDKTLKKINEESFIKFPKLKSFVNIITNAARVSYFLYQHGDGFGDQDREMRKQILSLLVEPFILN